jgi:hypothetical protein
MRSAAALVLVIAASLLAGCAPGADDELRGLVDETAPDKRDMVECAWGSSSFEGEPKAYYGCSWYVPGDLAHVSFALQKRLAGGGLGLSCREGLQSFGFTLDSETNTVVYAEVHGEGSRGGLFVAPGDYDIPPGHVLVEITARKERGDSRRPLLVRMSPSTGCRRAPDA